MGSRWRVHRIQCRFPPRLRLSAVPGRSATAAFEFHDGGLSTVKFSFHLGEDYEEWIAEQVQTLTSLYGQETDKMENSSDGFASKGYRWDTENTSLQIILMTGEKIKPSGTIVVGVK